MQEGEEVKNEYPYTEPNELDITPELLELIEGYGQFLVGHKVPCTFVEWYSTFKVG